MDEPDFSVIWALPANAPSHAPCSLLHMNVITSTVIVLVMQVGEMRVRVLDGLVAMGMRVLAFGHRVVRVIVVSVVVAVRVLVIDRAVTMRVLVTLRRV